jgi:succinate-semialdehyde dehydrogenase/glutarate-semialdehyde dehydrogenase
MTNATVNPATGEIIKRFESLTDLEIENKLNRAWKAFEQNRKIPITQRAHWLN